MRDFLIYGVNNSSFRDIILYKHPILNNHILNSLLMKIFNTLSGNSELVLRLPNYFGFLLFFIAIWKVFKDIGKKFFLIFGILFLISNLYLLDFFSLARGYGLGVGLSMMSFALLYRYFLTKRSNKLLLWLVLAFSALSVYANFSFTSFHLTVCLILLALIIKRIANKAMGLDYFKSI